MSDSIDRFIGEAISRNAAITVANQPRGVHGFDSQTDDDRSREIIRGALAAGVDEMAHLPGYYFDLNENPNDYRLTEKDVKETAARKVWVVPTPNLPQSFRDAATLERVEKVGKHTLALLKMNHARIAFGAAESGF